MLSRMKDLILPGDASHPMGKLFREDYARVANGLKKNELIRGIPEFSEFYRKCAAYD
jgi:hypothetical protein